MDTPAYGMIANQVKLMVGFFSYSSS